MAKGLGISSILNQESLALGSDKYRISYIDISKIQEHEKNRQFDRAKVEALARDIEDLGLQEPVVLADTGDDHYLLISGHRRLTAFRLLASEGKKEYQVIPAVIRSDTDPGRVEEMLIGGNLFNEGLSDAEMAREVARKKELLQQRKAAGAEVIGSWLDIIAAELGINHEAARRLDTINRRAEPEVKQEFEAGNMSLREAFKTAQLPAEQQKELVSQKRSGEVKHLFPEKRVVRVPPQTPEIDVRSALREDIPDDSESSECLCASCTCTGCHTDCFGHCHQCGDKTEHCNSYQTDGAKRISPAPTEGGTRTTPVSKADWQRIMDLGYCNNAIKGYLIHAMQIAAFSRDDICKALGGLKLAFDEMTACEAVEAYQAF
jgi:ParB-like chromosome segregation protein Spo0J